MLLLNSFVASIIAALAFWCVINPKVKDGIVGKCLYVLVCLAALGVVGVPFSLHAMVTLNATLAALWARNFFTELFWPVIRANLMRRIRCATCPHNKD